MGLISSELGIDVFERAELHVEILRAQRLVESEFANDTIGIISADQHAGTRPGGTHASFVSAQMLSERADLRGFGHDEGDGRPAGAHSHEVVRRAHGKHPAGTASVCRYMRYRVIRAC